ncbi:MAG: septal ring lytic transglycosylase RlpA family protein [Proteobacteria bacterium]|nr:septal ring lytic transglycosylase RlpA family protein [Pseudomonadota bacterium]MBU1686051.1 septal ring lytic transglycosylase RlpA family protein [Pseudomonadota bacterium]
MIENGSPPTKREKTASAPAENFSTPAKQVPDEAKIHPTQRPYKINGKTYYPLPSAHGYLENGIASWYGADFHGKKTSNGETYNMYDMTAAHKTLPMNTYVVVKNLDNDREITVRINDRGPFVKSRIIDLSKTGATKLGYADKGTARVRLTALGEAISYQQGEAQVERFKEWQDFQSGDFYVQIGSFTNRANADQLKEKMISWGKNCVIQTFQPGDQLFYRVQVKSEGTLAEARHLESALEQTGFPGAFVVAH